MLQILKIIGIVLLVLLILIGLFLVLPMKLLGSWNIDTKEKRTAAELRIRTFLRFLHVDILWQGEFHLSVSLFWGALPLKRSGKGEKNRGGRKKQKKSVLSTMRKVLSILPSALRSVPSLGRAVGRLLPALNLRFRRGSYVRFAGSAPDTTGIATGIAALLPLSYRKNLTITPDFTAEEAYLTGIGSIDGHPVPICIIISVIRLFIDPAFQELMQKLKENKGGKNGRTEQG